jgi:hypothetical protein
MPRTIHVTVTYSVHIEDDKISDKQALIHARENFEKEGSIFDIDATVHDRWKNLVKNVRKGIGSYK